MWRYGFNTPTNVNDHETNCGGFGRQWDRNKGKLPFQYLTNPGHLLLMNILIGLCGVCGDAYDVKQPRPNEMGGEFGLGVIAANLTQGQIVKVEIELTAYHQGYFQMRLCPHNRRDRPAAQSCLDRNLLNLDSGAAYYYPAQPDTGGLYELQYRLPADLTCDLCVLQWRYVAGNSWGRCDNGTEAIGCGAQEEFRACADVHISSPGGWYDDTPNQDVDSDGQVEDIIQSTATPCHSSVISSIIVSFTLVLIVL